MALVVYPVVSAFAVLLLTGGIIMSPLHFEVPWRFHFLGLCCIQLLDLSFLFDGFRWENFLFLVAVA